MRILLLLFFVLFISTTSSGQRETESADDFLKNFYRQDLVRNTLEFSLGTSGGIGPFERVSTGREVRNRSSLVGGFTSFNNSPKLQQTTSTFLSANVSGETTFSFDINREIVGDDFRFGSVFLIGMWK